MTQTHPPSPTVQRRPLVAERLGDWASSVTAPDLPGPVAGKVADSMLDALGVALAGSQHEASRRLLAVVTGFGGHAQSSVLGHGLRTSAPQAALANAYFGHVLDFDDTHVDALVHVNSPVLAATLAAGEVAGASGATLLAAHAAGMEVTSRVALAIRDHHPSGAHLTGVAGAFGAAAAAARALELDARRAGFAIAMASTLSSGLRAHRGTMTKAINPAHAASSGVLAAVAARQGMTSELGAIEHPEWGFLTVQGGADPAPLTRRLGEEFLLTGSAPKPYPCGVVIHAPVSAVIDLLQARGSAFTADEVAEVRLTVHPYVLTITGRPAPADGLGAKFSVFHAVAAALLDGNLVPEHFTDAAVARQDVLRVRDRISATADERLDRHEAVVEITTSAGETLRRHADALSSPRRPMRTKDVQRKFLDLAAPLLGQDRAAAVVETVAGIADVRDTASLLAPLRGPVGE